MPPHGIVRNLERHEIQDLDREVARMDVVETEDIQDRMYALCRQAEADKDERLLDVYRFLARVFSLSVEGLARIDQSTNPLWILPSDLNDAEIQLLQQVSAEISDPEFSARVSDFLWIRTRDRIHGEKAVDGYSASAFRLRQLENWTECIARYERAANVAASLGKKNARYVEVIAAVEQWLKELDGSGPLLVSEGLMQILLDHRMGDRDSYSQLAGKFAHAAESRQEFLLSERFWNLQARWYGALRDKNGEREARIAAAETVVKDAELRLKEESPSFLVVAQLFQRAIGMLQKAGNSKERIAELMIRLRDYQLASNSELRRIEASVNVNDLAEAAREAVRGKPLVEAIYELARRVIVPRKDRVRELVKGHAKRFPLSHRMGEQSDLSARAEINVARQEIIDEHDLREEDLWLIVRRSQFVPPSREGLFVQGLTAGFRGDFPVALHLLIPQIEPAIRWNLNMRNVPTTKINRYGHQEEKDLNELLLLSECEAVLGEDLRFTMQAIAG